MSFSVTHDLTFDFFVIVNKNSFLTHLISFPLFQCKAPVTDPSYGHAISRRHLTLLVEPPRWLGHSTMPTWKNNFHKSEECLSFSLQSQLSVKVHSTVQRRRLWFISVSYNIFIFIFFLLLYSCFSCSCLWFYSWPATPLTSNSPIIPFLVIYFRPTFTHFRFYSASPSLTSSLLIYPLPSLCFLITSAEYQTFLLLRSTNNRRLLALPELGKRFQFHEILIRVSSDRLYRRNRIAYCASYEVLLQQTENYITAA